MHTRRRMLIAICAELIMLSVIGRQPVRADNQSGSAQSQLPPPPPVQQISSTAQKHVVDRDSLCNYPFWWIFVSAMLQAKAAAVQIYGKGQGILGQMEVQPYGPTGAIREDYLTTDITASGLHRFLTHAINTLAVVRQPVAFPQFETVYVWSGQEGTRGATLGDVGGGYNSLAGVDFSADYTYSRVPNTDLSVAVDPTNGRRRLEAVARPISELEVAVCRLREVLNNIEPVVNNHDSTISQLTAAVAQLVNAIGPIFIGVNNQISLLDANVNDHPKYEAAVVDYTLGTRISLSAESDFLYSAGNYYDLGAAVSRSFPVCSGNNVSGVDLVARVSSADYVHPNGVKTFTTVDSLGAAWQDHIAHYQSINPSEYSPKLDSWRFEAGYVYSPQNAILESDQHEVFVKYKIVPGVITTLYAGTGQHEPNFLGFSVGFDLAMLDNWDHGHN